MSSFKKKYGGLSICAKTQIFGTLTLDRLFEKLCVTILLILIICQSWPAKVTEMAKIIFFPLFRPQHSVKNQFINYSRTNFLKNHVKVLHANFQAILTTLQLPYLFLSNFRIYKLWSLCLIYVLMATFSQKIINCFLLIS